MSTVTKYYKNEQSYLNQLGYFRLCYNQIRKDKSTSRFKKVKTTEYSSLLQEMYEYRDNEYICAGLNSFEREVVVIDNDDESFGKSTLDSLNALGLVPHCQKVKSNGHSQTYFFIKPYRIGTAGFDNHKYYEVDFFEDHNKWKRLTKMMNYLFNGDLCYTGYNCQNPLYVNADVTSYRNVNKLYTFDELYDFCLDKMRYISNLDGFLQYMRRVSQKDKKAKKVAEDKDRIIIVFKDKLEANQSNDNHPIITNDTVSKEEAESAMDKSIEDLEDRTINGQIFISCCCTCKSFHFNNMLNFDNYDYIARTCYKDYTDSYFAVDYTTQQLINRIRDDVRQIIYNDKYGKMQWNKVGYTKRQRELSLKTRKNNHAKKFEAILSIITNDTLMSTREIAKKYAEITGEKINHNTVARILKEIKANQTNDSHPIITNDTVSCKETNYTSNLAEAALEEDSIGETNGSTFTVKKNCILSA